MFGARAKPITASGDQGMQKDDGSSLFTISKSVVAAYGFNQSGTFFLDRSVVPVVGPPDR